MSEPVDRMDGTSDEELVVRLGRGDETALRALHRRYASLVFTVASRVAPPSSAEEIVQDVFMTLWRKHDLFEPARGSLKGWLCQVARNAALNVRRQSRVPLDADADAGEIADASLEPDEALWEAHRRSVLRAAVDALPARQREALSLAYFDDLTQEQVSAALHVPLGTAKSRIRMAMRRLAPAVAAVLGAVVLLVWWRRTERESALEARALVLVTSSDIVPRRLEATASAPSEAHANYRARPGEDLAVLNASHLPALPKGVHYVWWVRHETTWHSLGELEVRADGSALRIAEDPSLRSVDEIMVTRESTPGSTPRGVPVATWPVARP